MDKLNITFDARMSEHSGIGTYIKNLLKELDRDKDVELTVICKSKNNLDLSNVKKFHYLETDIYSIKEQYELIKFFPKKAKNNYFWSPHINIPLMYGCKNLIVTVHDLLFFEEDIFPQNFFKRAYRNLFFKYLSKKSKIIFTPSQFTKDLLNRRYPITSEKTVVTHLGVNSEWRKSLSPKKKKEIIFIGNIKKNKNLGLLLKAFNQIKNQIPHNLVIIGASENMRSKEDLTQFDINEKRVVIEGRLSDVALVNKISEAELVVCPSLYEGFGLVPVESYAIGTKVLCSDIPVHREVMGGFANFFKSGDIDSCAQEILNSLSMPNHFNKEKLFQKYDWYLTAEKSKKSILKIN
ncbi:MAG: glycosyltransferase family 1 protein [Bdellovibrionota bacterium]